MELRAYGHSECGPVRDANEDFILLDQSLGLFVLCDGMGGHAAGQVAARAAAEAVRNFFFERQEVLRQARRGDLERSTVRDLVQEAGQEASQVVFEAANDNASQRGMGTTLTFLLSAGNHAFVGHVGDSRAYLVRQGRLHQITRDHTLRQEMLSRGVSAAGAAALESQAHVLTRAIGIQESVAVDVMRVDLIAGDAVMLCSDGLYDVLRDTYEIAGLFNSTEPKELAKTLVNLSIARGAGDNSSAVIIFPVLDGAGKNAAQSHSEEILLRMEALRCVHMFQDLELRELLRVVDRCYVVEAQAGEELIQEGQVGEHMYIILSGSVEVSSGGQALAKLEQGNHFGEMTLLNKSPRSASVRTLSAARFLRISRDDFVGLLQEEPSVGVDLLLALSRELSSRLYATNQMVSLF